MFCCCHRQTCRVCVDQRLAATEATCTGPCSAPPKLQKTSKRREKDYTASCGACRKPNTRVRERENKKMLRKEKERRGERKRLRKFAKSLGEKRRLRYGKSLKEDLWFGKGVASA